MIRPDGPPYSDGWRDGYGVGLSAGRHRSAGMFPAGTVVGFVLGVAFAVLAQSFWK